jgi:dihydrofolate reductase
VIISLIAAMDEKRGIGVDGHLPWHLPVDLKRFKSLTMGHHLIMGRKTYESIGRPLPGRTTIIITRNPRYQPEGCLVAHSLETALEFARLDLEEEVFIIGGGDIFDQAIGIADRIYLTRVHTSLPADVHFPEISFEEWFISDSDYRPSDEKNHFPITFEILDRVSLESD